MLLHDDPAHAFLPYPAVPVSAAGTGPLAGLSFAVKDLIDVAGYPTGAGNPLMLALSGAKPQCAPVVRRLLDAGARFVGKTHTDELAYSMDGRNLHFGTPRNAAAPDRLPGGSSSGSASAVSHGLCDAALGTDTGGSVRIPASHCGLYGLRPTHGRVPLDGVVALAPSFDTCGCFTRDAHTLARVAEVLVGPDAVALVRPRLMRPSDLWGLLATEVALALAPALQRIESRLGTAQAVNVAQESFDALADHARALQAREAWRTHGPFIQRYAPPLDPAVAERFDWGRQVEDGTVAAGDLFRGVFRRRLVELLGTHGVLVLPTAPDIAPRLDAGPEALAQYRGEATRLLCIAGLAGLPQVTLPLARKDDAPLGISLIGPPGSDRSLVALCERIG